MSQFQTDVKTTMDDVMNAIPFTLEHCERLLSVSKILLKSGEPVPRCVASAVQFALVGPEYPAVQTVEFVCQLPEDENVPLEAPIECAFRHIFELPIQRLKEATPVLKLMLEKFPEYAVSFSKEFYPLFAKCLEGSIETRLPLIGALCDVYAPKVTTGVTRLSSSRRALNPAVIGLPVASFSFPQHLLDLDPKFWEVLRPYILKLSYMVDKDVSLLDGPLHFLLEFNELLSFRSRWTFFTQHQSMKRINNLQRMEFKIHREAALDESFAIFRDLPAQVFLSPFVLTFIDEPGIDAGGLTRNWLVCVVRDLIRSKLFKPDIYHRAFFPTPGADPETLLKLRFGGRVIARAVIQNQPVAAFFSRFVLKELMAAPPTLADLADVDPDIYTSLKEIMEGRDVEDMGLTFAIMSDSKEHELTPGGATIEVTTENRREYVELALKFYLARLSGEGLRALISGFHELIPAKELRIFDADELEWVLCGRPKFDMKDFKANLGFIGEYGPAHPVIVRFFEVLDAFPSEMRLKFLGFVTNSTLLPAAGFGCLPQQIKICPKDDVRKHPSASTCEYLFYLPPYETVDLMREMLEYAINNTDEGFGIK
jgi:hypothetical protein